MLREIGQCLVQCHCCAFYISTLVRCTSYGRDYYTGEFLYTESFLKCTDSVIYNSDLMKFSAWMWKLGRCWSKDTNLQLEDG